jgi:phosphoglycerol transferase
MVFQLPYAPFPEPLLVGRMEPYELFRGYLHSRTLRWSYGTMKGRAGDLWQRSVCALPTPDLVRTVALAGFDGIYVNRKGYLDRGMQLEAELRSELGVSPLVSGDGSLSFFDMTKYAAQLRGEGSFESCDRSTTIDETMK